MSFDARDLAIQLTTRDEKIEGLWAMACPACASTGDPKPACPAQSKPCPAASKPGCPAHSKKAGASGEGDLRLAGLAVLRQQLHSALSQAG